MTEVGGAVPGRHERGEPGGGEDLGFEGEHIGDVLSGFERMPRQVEHGRGEVLDRVEALPEPLTVDQRGDELGRHRLTRVDVLGVMGQDLRVEPPHLIELGRELHIVARDRGARRRRVGRVREQSVQHMTELVEERLQLGRIEQGRPSGAGLGEVEREGDDRQQTGQA